MNPSSLFSLAYHLEALSKHVHPLEVLNSTIDFEYFRGLHIGQVEIYQANAASDNLNVP